MPIGAVGVACVSPVYHLCVTCASPRLTSVGIVEEDELVPVVVVQQGQQRSSDGWPQLQRELALALGGEAGRDEGDVQGTAEGRQRVHRALVVQAEDGEDAAGVLGADWEERGQTADEEMGRLLWEEQKIQMFTPPGVMLRYRARGFGGPGSDVGWCRRTSPTSSRLSTGQKHSSTSGTASSHTSVGTQAESNGGATA